MLLGKNLNDPPVNDPKHTEAHNWTSEELVKKMEQKNIPTELIAAVKVHHLDGECLLTFSNDEWKEIVPEKFVNE